MTPSWAQNQAPRFQRVANSRIIEAVTASIGILLAIAAVAANQRWLDSHFLPSFFLPRPWYVLIETITRIVIAVLGVSIAVILRPRVAYVIARAPRAAMHVMIAVFLALVASELALRWIHLRPTEWLMPEEEPRRQLDERLGWVLAPARTGRSVIGGRAIDYAVDAAGYRVQHADKPVDRERPTVVFAGESVMFGEGLMWHETIPAQVEMMLGIQSANLAVHGYSNDQAYLRLERELPRFHRPVAVVALFMTELFGRNLDDDRPHLGPGLVWLPAEKASRLASLAGLIVPYRTDKTVEQGVALTGQVLHATVGLARARGATPLIVVPQFGPEDRSARTLRHRIMDDDLPSVLVTVNAAWRLPWDRHPNARAAQAIAEAIVEKLQQR